MIDESKHMYWKPIKGVSLKNLQCPRCYHYISINDFNKTADVCPFCGKRIPIKREWFDIVETKKDTSEMSEMTYERR